MPKNWAAIKREPNSTFGLFVATTEDPRILRGLRKGFPHLFTSKKTVPVEPIPLSTLLAWGEKNDENLPENIMQHFHIPCFCFGGGVDNPIPKEWLGLAGDDGDAFSDPQKIVYIKYNGVRCLMVDHSDGTEHMALVPEQFIDISR